MNRDGRARSKERSKEHAKETQERRKDGAQPSPAPRGVETIPAGVGWVSALAAFGVATVTLLLAAPDVVWLDTGEIIAASFELGIVHPPGHPLPSLFGKLISLIPLGTVAFRVNLASGLALAGAVAVSVFLCWEFLDGVLEAWFPALAEKTRGLVALPLASAGVLVFAVTGSALMQGVRAEVYAANLALSLGGILGVLRWWKTGRAGPLWAGGLAMGLSLSNHHLLALSVAVPLGLFVSAAVLFARSSPAFPDPHRHRKRRELFLWLGGVVLGMSVLVYLPLRASADPLVNWGHPDTIGRALWTFSAKIFSKTATESVSQGFGTRALVFMGQTVSDLGWATVFLSFLGLYLACRSRRTLPMGLLLTAMVLTSAVACLLGAFLPQNPDSRGYMLTFLLLVAVLATLPLAMAAAAVLSRLSQGRSEKVLRWRTAWVAGLCLPLLWTVPTISKGVEETQALTSWSRFELNRHLFDELPPSALFLAGYHETVFGVWYGVVVCGYRPDLVALYRHNTDLPGRTAQLSRRWPQVEAVIQGLGGETRGGADAELLKMARWRPVYVEPDNSPSDPLGTRVLSRLRPMGLLAELTLDLPRGAGRRGPPPATPPTRVAAGDRLAWQRVMEVSAPFLHERGVRRYLLWRSFNSLRLQVRYKGCRPENPALKVARSIAPKDPLLAPLLQKCGAAPGGGGE